MATHTISIISPDILPQAGAFFDRIGNQVAATNEIGNQVALVLPDLAADIGFYDNFRVPNNYVGTPKIVLSAMLDGAMTSVTLGIGVKGLVTGDGDPLDTAYSTQDIANTAVNHDDKDEIELSITLSNLVPVAGKQCTYIFFRDDSVTTWTGNLLVLGVYFQYADI